MRSVLLFLTYVTLLLASASLYAQDLSFSRVMTAGSDRTEMALGVHVDTEGNVYSTGDIAKTVTFGENGSNPISITTNGGLDAFVCKQDSMGVVEWSYGIGGSGSDRGHKVRTDKNGDVYVLGYFASTVDFDPGAGSQSRTSEGDRDGFLLKLTKDGKFAWVTTFGGSNSDVPTDFAIDKLGNIFVTGYFSGTSKFGNTSITAQGGVNIFVAKFDELGNNAWAHAIGAAGARGIQQQGLGLTVDQENNVIVTGNYSGTVDFNPGVGVNNLSSVGNSSDIFLLKLSSSGIFVWAKSIGSTDSDYGHALKSDKENNIYITGYFSGTVNFNPNGGTLNLTSAGSLDGFVGKYNASGEVLWAKNFGSSTNQDQGIDLALDDLDNVYVTGFTNGNPVVDYSNMETLTGFSGHDIIILKYDKGGVYQWSKLMGGIKPANITTYADSEVGLGIDVDRRNGAVYTAGYYQEFDIDFDPDGVGEHIVNIRGGADIFVHRLHCPADTIVLDIEALCDRTYSFNDEVLTAEGQYSFYYRELGKCDSIIILNLTLTTNELPSIQVNERILSTVQSYKSYQWLKDGEMIPGAVNREYHVTENGNYQVVVTHDNDCIDTSTVYVINNATSVNNHPLLGKVNLYPNPVTDVLHISSPEWVSVKIASLDGRVLMEKRVLQTVNLVAYSSGIYMVYIYDQNDALIKVEKLNKQ